MKVHITMMAAVMMSSLILGAAAIPPPSITDEGQSEDTLECQCALFLITDSLWQPDYEVFRSGQLYNVSCEDPGHEEECRALCDEENTNIERIFSQHPESQTEYPPEQSLSCSLLPAPTATFYSSCGKPWTALFSSSYTHVCCHPITGLPAWCESIPTELYEQPRDRLMEDARGLDIEKSPTDVENNEIEGSAKPQRQEVAIPSTSSSDSWMNMISGYLGYNSLTDLVKGFDIFTLPARFRHFVKTYRDEVNMGQCYMEYTTYSIFTKGENPLDGLIRKRRDAEDDTIATEETIPLELTQEGEDEVVESRNSDNKKAQVETIKSLVGSMANMLDQTEGTKRYAQVIRQLLPVVTQVYAAEDPQQAVGTLVSLVLGPYLDKINGKKPKPEATEITKKKDKLKSKPVIADPPAIGTNNVESGEESPIAAMLLNILRQYMGTYFKTLQGSANRPSANEIDKIDSTKSPLHAPSVPGGLINLMNVFLGGASPQRRRPRPTKPSTTTTTTTNVPKIDESKNELLKSELARPKDFVDVILEVIRPVFISILGRAPGDSGVASIREVSRLSVLGRVDDALANEVLSPYFCLKTYGVNKAWSVTERTLRTFVASLSDEEKETFRALIT